MVKKLILEPAGGLGNRILMLISAFNLARNCGIENITVLWRNNNECGCDYEDVFAKLPLKCYVRNLHFEKESYRRLAREGKVLRIARKAIYTIGYRIYKFRMRKYEMESRAGKNTYEDWDNLRNLVLSSKKRILFIEAYYSFYGEQDSRGMLFNQYVVNRANEYADRLGPYVAMHIRRTDNIVAIKNSPTELFYNKIAELVEEDNILKVYVATDDTDIISDLSRKYPNNVLSESSGNISRTSSEGIQFALYELLILAHAHTIYASFGSTFTQVASIVGRNEIETLKI